MIVNEGINIKFTPKFSKNQVVEIFVEDEIMRFEIVRRNALVDVDGLTATYRYSLKEHTLQYFDGTPVKDNLLCMDGVSEVELEFGVKVVEEYKEEHTLGEYLNKLK